MRDFSDRAPGARLASLAAFFVNGSVFGVWATQIPAIKDHLDLSPGVLGVALLCLAAGALTAMVGTGALLGRVGSAPVIRVTALLFAAILPLPALMPDLLSLCAVLLLFGAAGGTMDVAMNAHGALVERQLGRPIMSSLHGMWSLGGLFGAGAGGLGGDGVRAFLRVDLATEVDGDADYGDHEHAGAGQPHGDRAPLVPLPLHGFARSE